MKGTAAFFAVVLAVGCAEQTGQMPSANKADDVDPEAGTFRCKVVEVLDDNVLEEGLGSIYDFGRDGFPEFDGSSIEVDLRQSDFSELESGLILGIGQMSIGLHSAADELERIEDDDAFIAWRGKREESRRFFTVRIFDITNVGWVHHQLTDEAAAECRTEFVAECEQTCEGDFECGRCEDDAEFECDRLRDLAKIDCREGVSVPLFDDL